VHSQGHAYLFQNDDKRVIFVIPFEGKYSLIGTTDVAVASIEQAEKATRAEVEYLVQAANRFLAKPISAPTSCGATRACAPSTTTAP
jgi:glycerol-3-phosphate dehydrogenase